jgi:hypothetical protein
LKPVDQLDGEQNDERQTNRTERNRKSENGVGQGQAPGVVTGFVTTNALLPLVPTEIPFVLLSARINNA